MVAGQPVWALAERFPKQGEWTEAAYLALPEGYPHLELDGAGCLEVLPMPTDRHQAILTAVLLILLEHVRVAGGWARPAGIRVRLAPGRFREPDVAFLAKEHGQKKGNEFWTGADVVAEVVSGGAEDKARDHVVKRHEYAEAGIPEYWIVDPFEETITVLTLDGGVYREVGVFIRGARATSATLSGVSLDVSAVLDAQ
jgi:Uma2 family endonuclease